MPVLDSTDQIMPRSALHHHPIGDDATKKEPVVSTGTTPIVRRASRLRPKQTDGEEEIKEWQRAESGTTRQVVNVLRSEQVLPSHMSICPPT